MAIVIKQDGQEPIRITGEDMIKIYEERVKNGEIDPNEHASLDGPLPQWIQDIGKEQK